MECGNCHSYYPVSSLISQSPKVVVTYDSKIDRQKRRVLLNLSVVSCNLICTYCDTETNKTDKNMKSNDNEVLYVGTAEYNHFCYKYSDICNILNIGEGYDGYGNTSAFTNHSQYYYFINGAYKHFDTAQYFVINDIDDNKDNNTDFKMENNDDNKIDNIDIDFTVTPGSRYTVKELTAIVDWIEKQNYDGVMAIGKYFEEQNLSQKLTEKKISNRANKSLAQLLCYMLCIYLFIHCK